VKLKKNEFLKDLDKIEDGEDIIKVLEKYHYEDPLLD